MKENKLSVDSGGETSKHKSYTKNNNKLPYSDLDLSKWRELGHIWTDSLWDIPSRSRGEGHKLDYHGNFVPQIATQTYLRFTKENDIVLDLFLGSGTSMVEARNLERRCIGVELNPELATYAENKVKNDSSEMRFKVVNDDSASPRAAHKIRAALAEMGAQYAQLLVLHPPYHDIIKFSDSPKDLSNARDVDTYLQMFEKAARNGWQLLEPGRFAVLVIGDKYANSELVPLGFYCMDRMNKIGFITKSIVVKNIARNEKGKGKDTNIWRYRALKGGFYIFKHEYVIIFRKPES